MQTCHVCDSPEYDRVLSRARDDLAVDQCRSCGFVYLASWKKSIDQADKLYDYYSSLDGGPERFSEENRERQQKLLQALAKQAAGRRLLDVGCGDGQLLETAGAEGWAAVGIDLSASAIELCKARGLDASQTDFFSESLSRKRFDAIVMSELIEHVAAPQRFLKRAEQLLSAGGVLYLTTPNFGSLARRALQESWSVVHEEHIGYFDRASLRKMAKSETVLREIKIETNNLAPSTFVAWLRLARSSGREGTATELHRTSRRGVDQALRRAFHRSRLLSASKQLLNRGISRAGVGDTLVAWFQKPAPPGSPT